MLKSIFDGVMDRRSTALLQQIGDWLPATGPVLDVGSGTGHLSARLERELGVDVIPTDVSDLHVTGRAPVLIDDGTLPFPPRTFAASLLVFMLHYPNDPAALLEEVARVTTGPIIVVQSLHSNRVGYSWLRVREFLWNVVAFHVSKIIGYVPASATFRMNARRFYTLDALRQHANAAGLRIHTIREQHVLPGGSLTVAAFLMSRHA
jgi:SAM-dependent methyltransferase